MKDGHLIKLITPLGMLLATALLAIYCAYAFMIGLVERSLPLQLAGVISIVATYGVAMVRPWSRHLVYLLTAGLFLKLGLSLYDGYQSGFYLFQYGSTAAAARALAPTFVMAVLFGVCCAIVHRQFTRAPANSDAALTDTGT